MLRDYGDVCSECGDHRVAVVSCPRCPVVGTRFQSREMLVEWLGIDFQAVFDYLGIELTEALEADWDFVKSVVYVALGVKPKI